MNKFYTLLLVFLLGAAQLSIGQSPGGVSTNMRLWLKANTGVTTALGIVTAWSDQSGSGSNASTVNGVGPTLTSGAVNSYPVITFAGTGGLQGNLGTNVTAYTTSAFIVTNVSSSTTNTSGLFSIAASGGIDSSASSATSIFERTTGGIATLRSGAIKGNYTNAAAVGQYHLFSSHFSSSANQNLFYTEGAAATSSAFTAAAFSDHVFTIGSRYTGSASKYLTGTIAEVILYDTLLSATQRNQVESYLAVKYGITLSQATAQNYTSSTGTAVWSGTGNATYKNNIFGVAVDNGSGLSQTSSVSINTNLLTLSGATGLTNGSYFMVGDNAGGNSLTSLTTLPNNINARLGTVWKVQQTGSRATMNFVYNNSATSFGYYAPIASSMTPYMLIDSNGDGIYETWLSYTSMSGSNITFNTSLPNGALFTFGYKASIDYGDAPGVPTLVANNGAGHLISSTVYLGSLIDAELDGQPSVNSVGDDTIGLADEDGVNFNIGVPTNGANIIQIGQNNTITVTASVAGYLNAWIDLNQDNTYNTSGSEYVIQKKLLAPGANTVTFFVSDSVMYGPTSMRFRFASDSVNSILPTGLATNGEVEDYKVYITAPLEGPCTNGFQNPSFENGPDPSTYLITNESNLPYWRTTATDHDVEQWHTGFNGVPAYDGNYFVELEANLYGALYQDVYTTPGTKMLWSFAHRGRMGSDTAVLKIGAPGATAAVQTAIDGNTAWGTYQGAYVVPANQYITRFEFWAMGSYGGNTSIGNFLDDVSVSNSFDYGDAPDSYGTYYSSNGPYHSMTGSLYLGYGVTCDLDGKPAASATLDSLDDGITFPTACSNCNTYTVTINAYNNSGNKATIAGWIDFNKNGVFESSERATITIPSRATEIDTTLTFTVTSFSAASTTTYARFRIANDSAEIATPYGLATSGEVEDYKVPCVGMPVPVPTSSGSPACDRGPLDLYATGSAPYYTWSGPNSYSSTLQNPVISSLPAADSGWFRVYAVYANGCERDSATYVSTIPCYVNLSGSFFDDQNGDGIIDGTDATTTLGQTVYAILSDNTNTVVGVSLAAANGAFSFSQAPAYESNMLITPLTSSVSLGATGPVALWPSRWVGTKGQYGTNNLSGTGVYSLPSQLPVSTGITNVSGVLLGYDRVPMTDSMTYLIPYPDIHTIKNLIPANGMGDLAGSDPEDGTYGTGSTFTITSLAGMNGNELFYDANGDGTLEPYEQITGVTTITNYIPGRLYIEFVGAGSLSASFTYGTTDQAGKTDVTPAAYVVKWVGTLPVSLMYFTAEPIGAQSLLSWATAAEIDNAYFTVERSADALHWTAIGQVAGAGTSSEQHSYSLVDEHPLPGVNYYRLYQVNVDGSGSYSDIQDVTFGEGDGTAALVVRPNPIDRYSPLYLDLHGSDPITQVSLSSAVGQTIFSATITPSQSYVLSGIQADPGMYIVTITTASGKQISSRIVLE